MLCYYRYNGTGILERLNALYESFGYFTEKNISIAYEGADAMGLMSDVMSRLRALSPKTLAGSGIDFTDDYLLRKRVYASGETSDITLPKTDMLYYGLKGGGFVCVRPSGTEPKLKIYVSVSKPTKDEAEKYAEELLSAAKKYTD
jgi:phosphoglucomutase